ncbi:MAG: low molecular weight protein arginine phosphatase [Clostridia bacterium]|nr:low molecular weight protein arginine phosphatase [Clostridia bacterium]
MKIMFICTGNICRSAMAEAMMKKMAKDNQKNIEVYSCGISADDGDIPTQHAIDTMEQYGIDLKKHRATHIRYSNIEEMDLILCATTSHKMSVLRLYPQLEGKVFTIKEYAGLKDEVNGIDIKDPWGYDFKTYQECAKEIEESLKRIVEKI